MKGGWRTDPWVPHPFAFQRVRVLSLSVPLALLTR